MLVKATHWYRNTGWNDERFEENVIQILNKI